MSGIAPGDFVRITAVETVEYELEATAAEVAEILGVSLDRLARILLDDDCYDFDCDTASDSYRASADLMSQELAVDELRLS